MENEHSQQNQISNTIGAQFTIYDWKYDLNGVQLVYYIKGGRFYD